MQNGGVDIIELGVPFSDPIADGPVIQESNTVSWFQCTQTLKIPYLSFDYQIALKNDIDYPIVLGQLREARSKGLTVPVLLMGNNSFDPSLTICTKGL